MLNFFDKIDKNLTKFQKNSDIVRRNSTILAPSFRFKIKLSSTLEFPNSVIEDVDDHGYLILPADTVTYRKRVEKEKLKFFSQNFYETPKSSDSSNEYWQKAFEPNQQNEDNLVEKIQWLELGIATGKRKNTFFLVNPIFVGKAFLTPHFWFSLFEFPNLFSDFMNFTKKRIKIKFDIYIYSFFYKIFFCNKLKCQI